MISGEEPFTHLEGPLQVIFAVSVRKERPQIPEDCAEDIANLIRTCWNELPLQRPSFADIHNQLIQSTGDHS